MTYTSQQIYEIPEINQIINSYLINEEHDELMYELLMCNQVSDEEEHRQQSVYVRYRNRKFFNLYYPTHIRYFIYMRGLGIDKKWTNQMSITDY